MAITTADRDALVAAIAAGVKRVQQDGQVVEYQSAAEMISALAVIDRILNTAAGGLRSRVTFARMAPRFRRAGCW